MTKVMGNPHIPSVYPNETRYSSHYGEWLQEFEWTYILTLRRHIALTESACLKIAKSLLRYSAEIKYIWMALERDRRDNMNHLHIILETGQLEFKRKEMEEALGITRHPKTLSYFSRVDSPKAVAMYCAKRIGQRLLYHNFHYQEKRNK